MDCETTLELISALIDDEISAADRALLEAHLDRCPSCRAARDDLRRRDRALRRTLAPWRAEADAFVGRFHARLLPGGRAPWPRCSLLVVDDVPEVLDVLARLLAADFDVVTARSAAEARQAFARRPTDLVLADHKMPGETGVQLLEWVARHHPRTVRLLMSGFADLETAIDAVNRGRIYQFLPKPWASNEELTLTLRNAAEKFALERSRDELHEELRELNRRLEERVAERTRRLEEANQLLYQRNLEMERLALTDPLTGLNNRRAIEDLAHFELRRHARYPRPLAVGLLDIDHFKRVNDEYLHTGGDEVLRGLAAVLTRSLRDVDSVGRIGGEEFLILARETDAAGATSLAERLRATVAETPIVYNRQPIRITVSLGFAVAEGDVPARYQELSEVASGALGHAKKMGRNRAEVRRLPAAGAGAPRG
jgi:diguanylate cyclase (GGDEF)-like protein